MRLAIPYEGEINPEFLPPESLWLRVEPLLPDVAKPAGRKRKPDWQTFFAIFYVLRTGIQWKALPRHWVCERTHCWLNSSRRILVRWEKKVANYTALLQLCCALITWKRCEV